MKYILRLLQFTAMFQVLLFINANAQQPFYHKGIGTATPDSSAVLDVFSVNKGILIPRLDSMQRLAIAAPATGLLVYDNSHGQFYYFNGSMWRPMANFSNIWQQSGSSIYYNNGNVGIGTTAPLERFHVEGRLQFTILTANAVNEQKMIFMDNNLQGHKFSWRNSNGSQRIDAQYFRKNGDVSFNRNVGIGQTSPAERFDVFGNIKMYRNYKLTASGNNSTNVYHLYLNRTAIQTIRPNAPFDQGMTLESDETVYLIETDNDAVRGWFDLNNVKMVWDGNLGLGNSNPQSKLQVSAGDVYIDEIGKGVILKSPNGQCWRYTPDNSGNLVSSSVTCP